MRKFRFAAVFIAVALVFAGANLATPVAHAEVTPNSASQYHRLSVGATEWNAIKRAQQTYSANDSTTLRWSVIKAKYKGSPHPTNWPRQVAAGWLHTGHQITGMPSADRAAAMKIMNQTWGIGPHMAQPMSPNCRGVTKHTSSSGVDNYYYNSCNSVALRNGTAACLPLVGFLAGLIKAWPASVIAGIMIFGCAVTSAEVATAMENSSLNAIIVKVEDRGWNPTPPGNEYIVVRVVPQ